MFKKLKNFDKLSHVFRRFLSGSQYILGDPKIDFYCNFKNKFTILCQIVCNQTPTPRGQNPAIDPPP